MKDQRRPIITFCFTDIEGSTLLARNLADEYPSLIDSYRVVIRQAVNNHFGLVIDSAGDGFFITFRDPLNGVLAAADIQKKLKQIKWPQGVDLKVRIGLHTGKAVASNSGYTGIEVHKTSRICDASHGGQILISTTTMIGIRDKIPAHFSIKNLGKYELKGFEVPENLYQLTLEGLNNSFPAPRAIAALPVVAVLPFTSKKCDTETEYFCDGVTTDIIHALARIPGLRVVSPGLSFALKRSELDPVSAGEKLKANAVLAGILNKYEDQLYVSVQLIDVDLDQKIWSSVFEKKVEEIFIIEEEISTEVAQFLHIDTNRSQVKKIQKAQTQNMEAYDFYIKGRKFYFQFSKQNILFALQMFQNATRADPEYALAYCGMADCYSYLYMYDAPTEAHLKAVEKYSKKAVNIAPDLAEAHASWGVALSLLKNYNEAEATFEKAISLDPQLFEAYYLYARVAYAAGKLDKAAGLFRDANRLRPEDYQSLFLAGQCFEAVGLLERAKEMREEGLEIAEKQLKFNPGDTRALYMGANGLIGLNQKSKAIGWLQRALLVDPDDTMLLYNAACIYNRAGMPDEAMACLERSFELGLTQIDWYLNDTDLNSLRETNRFKTLIEKLQSVQPGALRKQKRK